MIECAFYMGPSYVKGCGLSEPLGDWCNYLGRVHKMEPYSHMGLRYIRWTHIAIRISIHKMVPYSHTDLFVSKVLSCKLILCYICCVSVCVASKRYTKYISKQGLLHSF